MKKNCIFLTLIVILFSCSVVSAKGITQENGFFNDNNIFISDSFNVTLNNLGFSENEIDSLTQEQYDFYKNYEAINKNQVVK